MSKNLKKRVRNTMPLGIYFHVISMPLNCAILEIMKTIRVNNFVYYSSVFGIIISCFSVLIGFVNKLPLPLLLGFVFLVGFAYYFNRYQKYRLELTKGKIKEISRKGIKEVTFKEIKQLDCGVIKGVNAVSLYPIFHLINQDNSETEYKVNDQAALFDIAMWVRSNYPSAGFTKNVEEFITKPRAGWFFGSKKL